MTSIRGQQSVEGLLVDWSVAQPLPEMARLMTDLLVARIEGSAGADDHHVVPTTLVRRASA